MLNDIYSVARDDIQDFIFSHEDEDIENLVLKTRQVGGVPMSLIAQQIKGRQKAKSRFPLLYNTRGIIYPPSINLEQSSSEATARFKGTLVSGAQGGDLTTGFGIDAFFMAGQSEMTCIEPDPELLAITRHNHERLGAMNVRYECTTAELFLESTSSTFDFLYLDPSRRKEEKKVFKFGDASPDISLLSGKLLKKSKRVVIKASPWLDIQKGMGELPWVSEVLVVALHNECKELLFIIDEKNETPPSIQAIMIDRNGTIQTSIKFTRREENLAEISYGSPEKFLFEPNAAILKAGAFKWIASTFRLKKLAPDSHLYTANEIVPDFPGRCFRIIQEVHLDKKLPESFQDGYANILTRNFPMKVAEIMKHTGLKEGGEAYLICSRTLKEKVVVIAEKIDLKPAGKSSSPGTLIQKTR